MEKLGEGSYNKSFKLMMANRKAVNSAANSTNRVGTEYIIMEYGCLFYRKNAPPGSCPAIIEGNNLLYEHKNSISEKFSIRPTVDTMFWRASAVDYVQALAARSHHAILHSPKDLLFVSHGQNNPTEHILLLQQYLSVALYLVPQEKDILGLFLWHSDLRTPNIFVNDTGHITSIINWQSIYAGPLFLEGCYPHLLNYNSDLILELPKNFKQLDENMQTTIKDKVTKSVVLYLYEKYTAERNPLLCRVFQYPNSKTLADPIRFSLIRVQKKWDVFGHTVRCPINFSPEEIRQHHEDGEGWNEMQDFWDTLSDFIGRDGWTLYATYDQAISIYSQIQAEAAFHSRQSVALEK
ncbi:hypothetical protein BDV18DRAFT_167266 [Aspergillus unguis]